MSLTIFIAIFFVLITNLAQWTSSKHELWWSKLWPASGPVIKKHADLLKERQLLHDENRSISAQDNYAKWTKNNRKLTQLDKQLEELREELQNCSKQQQNLLKRFKILGLTLPFLAFKLWKGKHIVFFLPTTDTLPKVAAGVCHNGLMYAAMMPLNFIRGVEPKKTAQHGVSLGIWLMALQQTINTIQFVITKLSEPIIEPIAQTSTTSDIDKGQKVSVH